MIYGLVNVKAKGIFKLVLECVYIKPGIALAKYICFVLPSLLKHSKNIAKIIPDFKLEKSR